MTIAPSVRYPRSVHWFCTCPVCQSCIPLEFRGLAATFAAVSDANKTLDKPTEACQG